jgi:hypothetical protein
MAVLVLSVAVRSEPVMTVVNGAGGTAGKGHMAHPSAVGSSTDRRVRLVLGDHEVVGKPRTRRGSSFGSRPVADGLWRSDAP